MSVPFEAETWPIIEHEPERIPDIPPDLLTVLTNLDAAVARLPEAEQEACRQAQESIVRARREGQRIASDTWVGVLARPTGEQDA
jgi:hypothetical protein